MLEMILKSMQNVEKENIPLSRIEKIVKLINKNKDKDKDITTLELANVLDVADKTIKRAI